MTVKRLHLARWRIAAVVCARCGGCGGSGDEQLDTSAATSERDIKVGARQRHRQVQRPGFNQIQLAGLNQAKSELGVRRARCSRTRSATTSRT